jgi:hypothetical protein
MMGMRRFLPPNGELLEQRSSRGVSKKAQYYPSFCLLPAPIVISRTQCAAHLLLELILPPLNVSLLLLVHLLLIHPLLLVLLLLVQPLLLQLLMIHLLLIHVVSKNRVANQ